MNGSTHGNLSSAEPVEAGHIPEWMLFELLMRLPSKVLFRLRVVSKQWDSMISDISFARMYVDRISRLPHSQRWFLVSSYANKAVTNDFFQNKLPPNGCSSPGANFLDLLILPRVQEIDRFNCLIVAISNGFLLYGPRGEAPWRHLVYSYEICNPVTGQSITLPPSQHCFEFVATGFLTQIEHNTLRSYRVVRVDVHHKNSGFITFDVYCSEIREWLYFKIYCKIYFYKWKNPVVLGKTLHWMISRHRVVAYDPYDKPDSVRLIRLPSHDAASYGQSLKESELDNVLFGEHQGHLRYFEVKLDGRPPEGWTDLSIWVLNDYDRGRWSLQHRVRVDGLSIYSLTLCFHPFDSDVVHIINNEALFSYDFGTRELKIVDDSRRNYIPLLPDFLSYFSFVIPPWPVSIDPSSGEETVMNSTPHVSGLHPFF